MNNQRKYRFLDTPNVGIRKIVPMIAVACLPIVFGSTISHVQLSQTGMSARVYPTHSAVILNDNLLLMAFRPTENSSSDLIVYAPWDTLSSLDLSTASLRRAIGENIAKNLPENLILERVTVTLALFHQPLMTVADTFTFSERIRGRELFSQDTVLPVMRALVDHEASLASIRISGWKPIIRLLVNSQCSEKYSIVPVALRPGLNNVRYVWRAPSGSGRTDLVDSVLAYYSIDLEGKPRPQGYDSVLFHRSEVERHCATCHTAAPASDDKASSGRFCLSCHEGMTKQRAVHGPVASKDCNKCHDTNPKSGYALVYQPKDENQACFGCHKDVFAKTKGKAVVHGPFGGGRCNYCHSPHASQNIYQLRKPINELCNSCHENKHEYNHPVVFHPVAWKPDPRNPERELSCISCHNPHASDTKNLLSMAGGYFALCQSCHSK